MGGRAGAGAGASSGALTAVDVVGQAEAITEGAPTTVAEASGLVEELSAKGLHAPIVPMLAALSRRALYRGWEPADRVELANTLREYQQFGYARRLLARVRDDGPRQRLFAPAARPLHIQGRGASCGAPARPRAADPDAGLSDRHIHRRRDARHRRRDLQAQMGAGGEARRPRAVALVLRPGPSAEGPPEPRVRGH